MTSTTASHHINAGLPEESTKPLRIGVIGAGAFGTSMAAVAARRDCGHSVRLWGRDKHQIQHLKEHHVNPKHGLESLPLPESIQATTSLAETCQGADILILALPAQTIPNFLKEHKDLIEPQSILCNTAKGLYVPTQQLLSDAILGPEGIDCPDQPYCTLSGPSFAVEILKNQPTAVVVASKLLYNAVTVQRALSSLTFRIYSSQDLVGVQLGGALKNPLAVGAGMIEGAGYGINTLAAYVTRSSAELRSLCIAMGGHPDTITGLSGVGDFMLTAFGSLSRNRQLGQRLMQGEADLQSLLKEKTVEGVPTAGVAVAYAEKCGLEAPFFQTIHKLLSGEVTPDQAHALLMNRPLKSEH